MFRAILILPFLSVALAGVFQQRYINPFGYNAHPDYRAYYQQSFRPYPARGPFYNNYYPGAYPYESFDGYDPYLANLGGNFRIRPYFANHFQRNQASPSGFYPSIPDFTNNRGFGSDTNGYSPLQFVLNDKPVQTAKPANLFTAFELNQLNRQAVNAPQAVQEVQPHVSAGQSVTTDDVAVIAILAANPSPLGADSVATLPDSIDDMAAIDEDLYVVIDDDQPAAGVQAMHVLQKDTPPAPVSSIVKQDEFPVAIAVETEEQAAAEKAQLFVKETEIAEHSTTTTEPVTVTEEVTFTSTVVTESTVSEATTTTTVAPTTESTTVAEVAVTTTTAAPTTESTTKTEAPTTTHEAGVSSSETSTSPAVEASTEIASSVATLNEDVPTTRSEELVRRSVSANVNKVPHRILINGYSEQGGPMTILLNRKQ